MASCIWPIIARFAAQNPELEISVDYDDRTRDLAREGFDIGIRIGAMRDNALMQRKLCEDQSMVRASPAYLLHTGRPETLAELQVIGYSHITASFGSSAIRGGSCRPACRGGSS